MDFGIDHLLKSRPWQRKLHGRRVGLVAHPASVTRDLVHTLDALMGIPGVRVTSAFGPQHGLRGEKQDNMIESDDYFDPIHSIPVFSLYGRTRRPTAAMLDTCDLVLVDLQDLGCRVYTFITTLRYLLEEAAKVGKEVWVLDRPNPIGRAVEGLRRHQGWESFVAAGEFPLRHGLTLGELGRYFVRSMGLDVAYEVVPLRGWQPARGPGYGWPLHERCWVNPSPNAPNLWMARCYPGTVMLEGTELSEGRGTTRPLELFGAPELDTTALLARMHTLAPEWTEGCALRHCWFEPTFHKHAGRLCAGLQIHVEPPVYDPSRFRPWRLVALFLKAIRQVHPEWPLWRQFPYEYEHERLAIDLINGGETLRQWVDDPAARPGDLDALARRDEQAWMEERAPLLLYT
ncbi:MAG: hypothetical protein KatS3mg077_1256 [Candidatus Binatia bacterium]|nr:MAG: hypothetical protein KatS3mg077_1256 [Candidatus Binatia bacterium]